MFFYLCSTESVTSETPGASGKQTDGGMESGEENWVSDDNDNDQVCCT